MCLIDDAAKTEELFLKAALGKRDSGAPKYQGFCNSCFATLKAGEKFCDEFCRDDWQKEETARRISGRRQ